MGGEWRVASGEWVGEWVLCLRFRFATFLLTTHYLLLTTYYLLLTTSSSHLLLTTYYLVLTTYYSLDLLVTLACAA